MKFINGCMYAQIKDNSVVFYNDDVGDFMPQDARSAHGVIIKDMKEKYSQMFFKVLTPEPYPERRRMMLEGIFFEESMYRGLRKVEAWKDDLIFYIYMENMLVSLIPPKPPQPPKEKKIKIKRSSLTDLAQDMVDELDDLDIDEQRDCDVY
jgi:hypothetical protein